MSSREYFDKVRDAEYSASVRALLMAWDTKDEALINSVLDAMEPLIADEPGKAKMMMAFLNVAHSLAFALAVFTNTEVAEIINMDAQADFQVQDMIRDGLL